MAQPSAAGSKKMSAPPLSKIGVAMFGLGYILLLHLAGLSLFTRGFLLSRIALDATNDCRNCTLGPPIHKKAVVIVIDSLRFDFIAPAPPSPADPSHHNVLTLPAQITSSRPDHSFIFNAHSDPPTATLQRIKGITTGSLPTFIDVGSNFGGSAILEDSLILQMQRAGMRTAFMGDDTWETVFPNAFNQSYPFDSFNVEDLHTVDQGVIRHIFPLLENGGKDWDVIIGHFLGVDHVGHRLGPSHPTMKAKLQEMNQVLTRVVELLDEDTLLVVLGDHGMDKRGDHGGDGELETSSALWLYSKGHALTSSSSPVKDIAAGGYYPKVTFPGYLESFPSVQQIDLVPTLALLLGLPIPLNNLGTVIHDVFGFELPNGGLALDKAMALNADQVNRYLHEYRRGTSSGELEPVWNELQHAFETTEFAPDVLGRIIHQSHFTRLALKHCRALWAQFNVVRMSLGLLVLAVSAPSVWAMYRTVVSHPNDWEFLVRDTVQKGAIGGGIGFGFGVTLLWISKIFSSSLSLSTLDAGLGGASLASAVTVLKLLSTELLAQHSRKISLGAVVLLMHAAGFASNSFVMWEDRVVLYLFMTILVPLAFSGLNAPTSHLRKRILGFGVVAAVCVRLMATSTVCREEQQPYCLVTFYTSAGQSAAPILALILALPTAWFLPNAVKYVLSISGSDNGVAPIFTSVVVRPALVGSALWWLLERFEGSDALGGEASAPAIRFIRTLVARIVLVGICAGGSVLWYTSAPCVSLKRDTGPDGKPVIAVLGFANAYGSSYLLFLLLGFSLVYLVSQLAAQLVLGLFLVALLASLEMLDSTRDASAMHAEFARLSSGTATAEDLASAMDRLSSPDRPGPNFSSIALLCLLGNVAFFATGHQAVLSTIQWKSAFVGFPTLTYPFSPILAALNTFGPFVLSALAAPLFAIWNVSPGPGGDERVVGDTLRAALGVMLYRSVELTGSSFTAAWLRRHLMVWKVFAPRFMLGAVVTLVVDVALILGVWLGVGQSIQKVQKMFKKDQ
ncbi:pyrophosphatase/phosphodiesterase [Ceratobasidium sp. AG-Ba]|nr:pyrophosphatase/phosphodiesterase [Ceratobasidium sp. AG-Ba]QRW08051.1 pyrophosphatase/phosphodiesterase [Ceratobasidium sp. AG-Ba]